MSKLFFNLTIFYLLGTILVVKALDEDHEKDLIKSMGKMCQPEAGSSDSDLDDMMDNKFASTKEGNCLRFCVMKKLRQMDNNGKLRMLPILPILTEKQKAGAEIINSCVDIEVDDDPCVATGQYEQCFHERATALNYKDLIYKT